MRRKFILLKLSMTIHQIIRVKHYPTNLRNVQSAGAKCRSEPVSEKLTIDCKGYDAATMNHVKHQLSKSMAPHTKSGDTSSTILIGKVARRSETCKSCGKEISVRQEYYSETVVSISQGPLIHFSSYCLDCGKSSGLQMRISRYKD